MAIHICRDFLTLPTAFPSSSMYLMACFAYGTVGYTQVGHTNFSIVSSSFLKGAGNSGSINFGSTGSFSAVGIPTASYLVSSADVNRILALRSDANPRYNSGLFRIQSVNTASNWLIVDYRAAENPPAETNTLTWSVFEAETKIGVGIANQTTGSAPFGPGGYKTRAAAPGKRIILQSPHSSSWQVRLCYESSTDRTNHHVFTSIAPGFNGDSSGDFASGSYDTSRPVEHLHGPMWFDQSSANYAGTVVAGDTCSSTNTDPGIGQVRLYMWGDSVSGSIIAVTRNVTNNSDGWCGFGMATDDELPLPPRTIHRLFAFGRATTINSTLSWENGVADLGKNCGVAFGYNGQPVSCVQAVYSWIASMNSTTHPFDESLAADSPILGATELQKVDLWAGTLESGHSLSSWPQGAVYQYEPRRMGCLPMAVIGRSNFGTWTVTSDASKSWYHTTNGVFLTWEGPAVLL